MEEMLNSLSIDQNNQTVDCELALSDPPAPEPFTGHVVSSSTLTNTNSATDDDDKKDEYEEYVIEKARSITELILSNCEEDRAEATKAINLIKNLIDSQDRNIHGGSLSRLIQAIDTRSNISMIIVKALESQAKILAARKGPAKSTITNTNLATSGNLIDVLEAGMKTREVPK